MRIVVLGPSVYSETTCAMAAHLAQLGHIPAGALVLSTLSRETLFRKLAQLGSRKVARYARAKLIPQRADTQIDIDNRYLLPFLKKEHGTFRSLREVGRLYSFPLFACGNQNAAHSIAQLRKWSPDLIIFTGGNILRKQLLDIPRLGVLNAHLGLLPDIRGMSSPEWSLLKNIPIGITIHFMDEGIDTGPVLQRFELPDAGACESLSDLRKRLIAYGVKKMVEVVTGIESGAISATAQLNNGRDNQFFVMHEWLQSRAAECLTSNRTAAVSEMVHG